MTRLEEIKTRLAAATPGPWTGMTIFRPLDGNCFAIVREHPDGEHISQKGASVSVAATLIPHLGDTGTAVMLLHSRKDLDYLVAEVERLRAKVDDLRLMVDGLETAAHEERAATVAWLRKQAESTNFRPRKCPLADAIERGEHRRKEEKP